MPFLTAEAIENLQTGPATKRYTFDVKNDSLSEHYILNPFWNWIQVNIFPRWIAPNLLTFLGFMCAFLGFVIVILDVIPPVSMIVCAVLFFLYQTLDGTDGKQARATRTSSQLGEIFDHGVDAIAVTLVSYTLAVCCLWGPDNPWTEYIYISIWCAFHTAHWEHFHTGTFYMGYLSACDGQNLVIFMLIITNFVGSHIWTVLKVPFLDISFSDFLLYNIFWNSSLGTLRNLQATLKHCYYRTNGDNHQEQQQVQSLNSHDVLTAILDLIPLSVLCLVFHFTVAGRPSSVFPNYLWREYHVFVILIFSIIFATLTSTLNLCRVTLLPFKRFSPRFVFAIIFTIALLWVLLPAVVDRKQIDGIRPLRTEIMTSFTFNNMSTQLSIVLITAIVVLANYLYFAIGTCREICYALDIEMFRIKNVLK